MGVEVQVTRPALATVIGRATQQQLRMACFPAVGVHYVDHVDAVPDVVEFAALDGAVRVRVPVLVHVVSEAAVRAAPNAVPVATSISSALVLRMAADGATASLRVVDVELPELGPVDTGRLKQAVIDAMREPLRIDLSKALNVLGTPAPVRSTVELTAETVAVRFDPATAVRARLHPGQAWGAFLDEPAMLALARQRVPDLREVSSKITSFERSEHWRPEGGRPRIDVDFHGKADVPSPLSGSFNGVFRLRLGIAPTVSPQLRIDIDWELHANLGALVPGFVDDVVETFAAVMVDPRKFGAVRTGLRSFQRDLPLPTVEFPPRVAGIATRFEWKSAIAVAEGTTLGGPVRALPDPGTMTVQTAVTPFGRPRGTVYASQHGCVPGWQSEIPDDLMVIAHVGLAGGGSVCGHTVLEPHTDLQQFVAVDETAAEAQTVRLRVPLAEAENITAPVKVIVATSRGVRLVTLGAPLNEEAEIAYIDDCLYADAYLTKMMAYNEWWTMWGEFPQMWPLVGGPPAHPTEPDPLDDPDHGADIDGLYVKVITVEQWEPGELVRVVTGTCTIDVTTDTTGRATIPVILSGTDRAQPIALTRINRGAVTAATAETAIFVRRAALPAGTGRTTLTVDDTGRGVLSAVHGDGSRSYELAPDKAPVLSDHSPERTTGPEPGRTRLDISLPGLADIVQVPGFTTAPVAIAILDDGAQLVLNLTPEGTTRVAGELTGWFPRTQSAGDWAVATSRGRLHVLRRRHA